MKNPVQAVGLLLSGPALLLIVLACLALFMLVLVASGRAGRFVTAGRQAADRLEQGGPLPTLWGLSAIVLVLAAAAVLSSLKILGLLALLVFLTGVFLLGAGLSVAAVRVGRILADAFGLLDTDDIGALRLGLGTLFAASCLPLLGWLGVALAAASGVGAFLETLFSRR